MTTVSKKVSPRTPPKFQYGTFYSIKISGNEICTGSSTGSEPEMTIFDLMGGFRSLEKSTKLSVSWYGVPVPSSRYLGKKLPIGDATVRRNKDDATVK